VKIGHYLERYGQEYRVSFFDSRCNIKLRCIDVNGLLPTGHVTCR